MPMSLNQAAVHRAAMNWMGAVGPIASSGMIIAIAVIRVLGPWPPLAQALGDRMVVAGLIRTLFAVQVPLVWLFVETTAWRRYLAMRRGRGVLTVQAMALLAAVSVLHATAI